MGHGPWIWNYRFGCATSGTKTCKVHKRGSKKLGCQEQFTNATRGPEMISPSSFCGFVFARAIDMNLYPSFLQNLLNKDEENNLIYYSETVESYTRFWTDISQLIMWICLHKGHRYMNLDPPFLYNLLNKNEENNLMCFSETVEFYTRFWTEMSQLILRICLRKGQKYELRPAIPVQPSEQKWRK